MTADYLLYLRPLASLTLALRRYPEMAGSRTPGERERSPASSQPDLARAWAG